MADEIVCQFNKFGFCKFRKTSFRKHEDKLCENGKSETKKCPYRHPKKCRFFVMYRNCKFGEFCRFGHDIIEDGKEVEKLKQQLEELRKRIDDKDKEIKLKDE